jgi:GNAT superfamily N-acetyltransferase
MAPERQIAGISRGQSLASILQSAAAGRYPSPDGTVTIVPQPSIQTAGVFALTAHTVVFTDADPGWIGAHLPDDDLSAPLSPAFLHALGEQTGRRVHSIDMVMCAAALPGAPPGELGLTELPAASTPAQAAGRTDGAVPVHPRIARALLYRDEVRAWQTAGGVVLLGRGVAGRWEVAVEVDPGHRGQRLGQRLVTAARHLVPGGAALWAQIAPGNAASVRAFLAAGFRPVGAEALLVADQAG